MEETTEATVTTRSVGIKFGLILGVISIVMFLVTAVLGYNPFSTARSWIGIGISIATLVFAQKQFKDEGDGFMSYGQGFSIGFWQSLVSLVLSMAVTYVYIEFIDHAPFDVFMNEQLIKMQEQGQPDNAIEIAQTWTKKLFWPIGIFFGLLGSLLMVAIVTIFTQKKNQQGEMV